MLRVGDRIANDVFEKDLEHTTRLFVNETGDTLDTTTTSETANGGLGNTLNVVAKDFAMTLGTALAQSFASFSTARHVDACVVVWGWFRTLPFDNFVRENHCHRRQNSDAMPACLGGTFDLKLIR